MDWNHGWRSGRSGSYRAAWVYLTLALGSGAAGLIINAAAGNPSKLAKRTALELGGLVLVLWAVALVMLLFAVSRFNRARHAGEQERRQATARQLVDEHLRRARLLAGQLLGGETPAVGQVWDVVLQPGERALLDGTLVYSRYYGVGSAATYAHVSTRHYGSVGLGRVALDHALDGAGNRRRAQEAASAAAARWRERQQCRVVVTDQRLVCQVQAKGWLSFDHRATTAIQAIPQTDSVVLEYPDTAPLCLSGPSTPEIMVVVVWALYGADGLREHPALSEIRSLAPFPDITAMEHSPAPDTEPTHDRPAPANAPSVDLLGFIAAHELVLAEHVAELLAVSEHEAAERLEELVEQGLVARVRFSIDSPVAYRITERGVEQGDNALARLGPLDLAGDKAAAAVLGG